MPRLRGFMGTNTSIFETQAKASLVCWSFWQGAEKQSGSQSRSRSNRDWGPLNNEPADNSLTPPPSQPPSPLNLCQEGLCLGISSMSCMLAIYNETKKFLEKKKNLNDLMNALNCRVSDFLTRYYSTDRGIIETSLKTSFSRSLFSLFSPIPTEQIPAFPRKGKSPGEEVEQILHPGGGYCHICAAVKGMVFKQFTLE